VRGSLLVADVGVAARELSDHTLTAKKVLRASFTSDADSIEMNVDGSTTPVVFKIAASSDRVKWVSGIRLVLHDANMNMSGIEFRRFASVTSGALTNGVDLFVSQGGVETSLFVSPVVRMGDFYDYSDAELNEVDAISAGVDFLRLDFTSLGAPVALPAGSRDFVGLRVSDDLQALNLFRGIATGAQELI
jgi:hypothetical protein